jgi:hypothetical protein
MSIRPLRTPFAFLAVELSEDVLLALKNGNAEVIVPDREETDVCITFQTGVLGKQVFFDPAGSEIWLYQLLEGNWIGLHSDGAMPYTVWIATKAMWEAGTPYEFALVCYNEAVQKGTLSDGELPPNPADFSESFDVYGG